MIRRAHLSDLPSVIEMIAEHAAFEGSEAAIDGLENRLAQAVFGTDRLLLWVVELDEALVGYASASREFATWRGTEHLHLDCLFLREAARGLGLGAALMQAVTAHAREQGLARVEWQTPAWNAAAIGFYRRGGALDLSKARFSIDVAPD